MAGAGFKTFNTGDVLTASDVNTYLMQQTVMVFADSSARSTALGANVAEGMISYLKDTNAVEVYNGSAWVSSDDPNAIQNSIVDAKGDLISASANDTPARLAVGNNGETLVADSSTSTGLRWQSNFAAGRNFSINGGVDIWQRGTTFTNTVGYTADRWYQGANNVTTTQETSSVPSGFRYAIKGTATASAQPYYMQAIETSEAVKLAGQTVVLSYYAATSDSSNVLVRLDYSTGTDTGVQGSFTTIASHSVAASSTFTRVQKTFDIPSTAKTLRILVGAAGNIANTAFFSFAGVQLEVGSIATGFTRAAGTLAGELAACQRYFEVLTAAEINGVCYTTANAYVTVPFKVTKRQSSSTFTYPSSLTNLLYAVGSGFKTPTAVATETYDENGLGFTATGFSTTSMAVGYPLRYTGSNITISAEL